jgi:4-diphosphocytidyl-2-C-methyl-D-erythritol kinase
MFGKACLSDQHVESLVLPSFAKINLCLEVLGKRKDGFHEIRTLLQTIDLRDRLVIKRAAAGVRLQVSGRAVGSGEDNLVLKAVELFSRHFGLEMGLEISLFKQIPLGARLGGGSSNAAVTLMALSQLTGCCLPPVELSELASELGSDVPFFLSGGLAFGWGRGERIERWSGSEPEAELLLLYPGFKASTKDAYAKLQAADLGNSELLTRKYPDTTIRRFQGVLDSRDWGRFRNDLEQPFFDRSPELRKVLTIFRNAGCDFAGMSGSGSTLFGTGPADALDRAERECVSQKVGEVIRTRFLTGRDYRGYLGEAGLALPEL